MSVRAVYLAALVVIAALATAPLWAPQFTITLLNYIGIYALVAVGVVLLTGVAGLTSFGQAAFVGIGAYATAWLTTAAGASPWWGLAFALLLTGLIATLLGAIKGVVGLSQQVGNIECSLHAMNQPDADRRTDRVTIHLFGQLREGHTDSLRHFDRLLAAGFH